MADANHKDKPTTQHKRAARPEERSRDRLIRRQQVGVPGERAQWGRGLYIHGPRGVLP